MLTMNVEVDPLKIKDPLDSKYETEIDTTPSCESDSRAVVFQSSTRVKSLKTRKLQNIPEKKNRSSGYNNKLTAAKKIQYRRLEKVYSQEILPNAICKQTTDSKKPSRNNLVKKQKSRKGNKDYTCTACGKSFVRAKSFKDHQCGKVLASEEDFVGKVLKSEREKREEKNWGDITKVSNEENHREHQCNICQKTFVTMSHLSAHVHCHSERKWKCDGCGKNFSCERSLTRHLDTFPGEHWFQCQHCDMNFFRVENILKHMEGKHPETLLHAKRTGQLTLPYRKSHKEKPARSDSIFICIKCLKIFYNSEDLNFHQGISHPQPDPGFKDEEKELNSTLHTPMYRCEICSKEFVSLEGYEYHTNNQHAEKLAKKIRKSKDVPLENSNEVNKECVKETVEDESLVCKTCGQSFLTKVNLKVHAKTHGLGKTGEVKLGNYQCCICPRSFFSSDGLKYHLATHTGERRFSCSECDKKFIKKTHLYEHLATHSKVKCFKCPRCPRTFCTHSAYRKHIKHFPGLHSFPCKKCGKLFTKESMLEKHICVDLVKVTMAPEVKALLAEENKNTQESNAVMPISTPSMTTVENELKDRLCEGYGDNYHSCYKCFKVFSSLDQLQSHQNEHIGKQQYQCRFCSESFKRADDFGAHIRWHVGSSPYMCLKCNRKFISPLTLSMHAKKYPGEHSFNCSKCQRWFPSEKRLDKHECILQNSETFICACGSAFGSWTQFQLHAGSKPYKCCSCEAKYLTLVALTRHIKKHTGVKPFSCEFCSKAFRAKSNYLHHLNIHKKTKETQCEYCDFKSKSKKRMDFHLYRKHGIGSNNSSTLCPVCGIIFPYMTHVEKHIETEHGNKVVLDDLKNEKKSLCAVLCTLCGKLLSNKYMLANHMKKIHDPSAPKTSQDYHCEVCNEKFRSKKRLERHAEIHEVPGLRVCSICSKEFFFAKDLRKHMKRHDTNKPFSCPKCGKQFKVSVSLKYHSSICGNVNPRLVDDNVIKRINLESNILPAESVYYGHNDSTDIKTACYSIIST